MSVILQICETWKNLEGSWRWAAGVLQYWRAQPGDQSSDTPLGSSRDKSDFANCNRVGVPSCDDLLTLKWAFLAAEACSLHRPTCRQKWRIGFYLKLWFHDPPQSAWHFLLNYPTLTTLALTQILHRTNSVSGDLCCTVNGLLPP